MPQVVVLRMSEELLVVSNVFCWTYNKFDFGKVNDNCSLVGIYRSHYHPRDSLEASPAGFLMLLLHNIMGFRGVGVG